MDIKTRTDIELLVNSFYKKVTQDDTIGFIFNDIVNVNWETHLPVMYDFWETVLLDTGSYQKNTMAVHFEVNRKIPLEEKHFKRWLELFNSTLDELFDGETAQLARKRAKSVADLMLFKMEQVNKN
jgi:hemoglobin